MPKRTDIDSILIIGAGPIIIGQACEFDYSGTQAVKALKDEGYRIILVNSNPATIMTDPEIADATYIEPITPEIVEKIIEKERPNAVLPTMGGQTALNTALALSERGTLKKYDVELIGADEEAIEKAENREKFRAAMDKLGLESARSALAHTMEEAVEGLKMTGLPAIIRPSFTLGGTGGGIAETEEEFRAIVENGLELSPTSEVLIEESIVGWKEYEMEVVRDTKDNCIIICSIENVDPMGIHTGDSITVAPALTLTDKEYQIMRDASIAILREIGVDTGGSNVQFAVNPNDGRLIVIEMNPRVSRSSALASKATGFPIAKVAAKLAVGYTLDELDNDITKVTPASFEPTIDYVVTKVPRFTFEKFPNTKAELGTAMKSVGEAMAIGRSFHESYQKALRSLETGLDGFDELPDFPKDKDEALARLALRKPDRGLVIAQAMRNGLTNEEIQGATHYDPWFLNRIREIVDMEEEIRANGLPTDAAALRRVKAMGFSDARLATLTGQDVTAVTKARHDKNIHAVYKRIDTCAAEFESGTPYLYSTYEGGLFDQQPECEAEPTDREKVIILGGGPNRIGQGIEFDYCCCHAVFALTDAGYETIMVNCNPETVSTDYDTSDRLYFEPLTDEDVLEIIRKENENGSLKGVIVQFGGQTPLGLANALEQAGVPILGTSPDAIDLAEDRERFQQLVEELGMKQPDNGIARGAQEAIDIAEKIGYPVVVRPSYVLGGRAMEIVYSREQIERYMAEAVGMFGDTPILVDKFLTDATEIDVDCIADDETAFVAGIMEHIEEAGVHSGDSACALPPFSLPAITINNIRDHAMRLAKALKVRGLMNVQFAVKDEDIYIIEVNPRASRTVPFVAKAIGVPVAKIAARVMAGEKLDSFGLELPRMTHIAFKEAVFPFSRFPGTDPILGPEMRSTGEVMGLDKSIRHAFAKSQLAAGMNLPEQGTVFVSVRNRDKGQIIQPARKLHDMGFKLMATEGTAKVLEAIGLPVERVNKVAEGGNHIVNRLNAGDVDFVINTTEGAAAIADSVPIRTTTLENRLPYYTTVQAARMAIFGIEKLKHEKLEVAPLQSYAKGSVQLN